MEKKLIAWSAQEYSHLPWRVERSLYRTLVSEIMLQQTTVQTVLQHFDRFMLKYPTLPLLARASEEEICIAWKGLGYYRRARNLRLAAIDIYEKYAGEIPLDFTLLQEIPGIGVYTANAIMAIGANKPALALDANLERVLSRYFWVDFEKGLKLQKELYQLFAAEKIFSARKSMSFRKLNEALMDLGRVYCRANRADCWLCPINQNCQSFLRKTPLELPRNNKNKLAKSQVRHECELLRVVVIDKNKIYTIKRKKGEWLEGQLEFPTFIISSSDDQLKQYPPLETHKITTQGLSFIKTSITKYVIKNYILELSKEQLRKHFPQRTFTLSAIDCEKSNYSTTTLKILKKIGRRSVKTIC